MSKRVTDEKALLEGFPYSLGYDEDKLKLARSVSGLLAQAVADTEKAVIYARVDKLPEEALDILAKDFKVDWYDFEGTLQEKRKTVGECMAVHSFKGTKFAVETVLKSIYGRVRVREWFEYGGEPFHFSVDITGGGGDEEKRAKTLEKIRYYKNLRSVLDNVTFKAGVNAQTVALVGVKCSKIYKKTGSEVKVYGL